MEDVFSSIIKRHHQTDRIHHSPWTMASEELMEETAGYFGEGGDEVHHEYSVRDRCQQIGISFDRVRYRVGIDRFKWLALLAMLKMKTEYRLLDDVDMDGFYQFVVPKLQNAERLNPLACVLMYYASIVYDPLSQSIQFKLDKTKLNYILTDLFPKETTWFQEHGVKRDDLVRYRRRFELTFSP